MKKIFFLLCFCLICSTVYALDEDTSIKDLLALPLTGKIQVDAVPVKGNDKRVVDFYVELKEGQSVPGNNFDILFFLGGKPEMYRKGVSLPFKFSRSFKGWPDGTHNLLFVVLNNAGFAAQEKISLPIPYSREEELHERFDKELRKQSKEKERLINEKNKLLSDLSGKIPSGKRARIRNQINSIEEGIIQLNRNISLLEMQIEQR